MRKGQPGILSCPQCGARIDVSSTADGFETKALASALETKILPLAFTVKSVDRKERTITGFASTPDLDQGDDIVEAKACKFTDPADIGVYIGHDWRLGALPTGVPIEVLQSDEGLLTKTRIYNTARGDELLTVAEERLAIGKPLGMSIGYPTDSVKATFERKDGRMIRRISSLELREYSFTPMPMNEKALTTDVKARDRGLKAADMSLTERQNEVREAIRQAQADTFDPSGYVYVVDVYDAYAIATDGDDYFRIDYTIGADGEATLGESIEVDRVWIPTESTDAEVTAAAKDQAWASVDKTALPKSAFAYAPGKNRSAWKLPHHNADGSVNAAGVKAALAALAGARTGKPMDVPTSVKAHLEAHEKALAADDKTAGVALATKAGKVLSDANQRQVQTIHDATHALADSGGFDLHRDADDDDSPQGKDLNEEWRILGAQLELDAAVATAKTHGGHN